MEQIGSTGEIIVALLLALGQLIEPVQVQSDKATPAQLSGAAVESTACRDIVKVQSEFDSKGCESMRENRRKFKAECSDLEMKLTSLAADCRPQLTDTSFLNFIPKTLTEVMAIQDNKTLITELRNICFAAQDRTFLERSQWQSGQTSDRNQLADQLFILTTPALKDNLKLILHEAAIGEFDLQEAYRVLMGLCHHKVSIEQLAGTIDFVGGLNYLAEVMAELPNVNQLPKLKEANFVLDKKGNRIGEIYEQDFVERDGKRLLKSVHRRRVVTPNEIPRMVFNAFIAIEDKRFLDHNGFDFESIKRVISGGVAGSTQGGSTFTMQLIKNALFKDDVEKERTLGKRTLRRKIKEILMIPMVEKRYSKDEILTYYLNLIDMTPRAQGVHMAALDLFDKSKLSDLKLEEIALLAALPKGTTLYNPRRNPLNAKERRDLVLKVMADQALITEQERAVAQAQPMTLVDPIHFDKNRIMARYFVGHLTNHFRKLRKNYVADERWALGGLDIKTSVDFDLQSHVMSSVQKGLLDYEKSMSRYQWTPWIDPETNQNMNIANRLSPDKDNDLAMLLRGVRELHPYPETNWELVVKAPGARSWIHESGETVAVSGGDKDRFQRLKDYDVALVEKSENGLYRLVGAPQVQGAAFVMDIESGEVLALSGGFSAGSLGRFAENNRATVSRRQPGSTLKAFSYIKALSDGVSPNQVIPNLGLTFPQIEGCGYSWTPKNYSGGGPSSATLRVALEQSYNLPVVNLFLDTAGVTRDQLYNRKKEAGVILRDAINQQYDMAAAFGAYQYRDQLSAKERSHICLPFLLGGVETTVAQLTQGYAAIANGGLRRDPVFLNEVEKRGMPLIVDRSQSLRWEIQQYRRALERGQVISPEAFGAIKGTNPQAIAQLRSILQGVLSTGTARGTMQDYAHIVGGKTGTTNNNRDGWFVGFTNKIAIGVWVGYDNSRDSRRGFSRTFATLGDGRTGGNTALPIFKSILDKYYELNPQEKMNILPSPGMIPGIVARRVNTSTGEIIPTSRQTSCANQDPMIRPEFFQAKFMRTSESDPCAQ